MKTWLKRTIIMGVLVIALLLSFLIDKPVVAFFNLLKNPVLDVFFSSLMIVEESFAFYVIVILLTMSLLVLKKRQNFVPYIISIILNLSLVFILKGTIQRPRPDMVDDKSFPSGHTTLLFTSLPFLEKKNFKWITILWLIASIIFILARLWLGYHYLSDVMASLVLSFGISFIVKGIFEKITGRKIQKRKNRKIKRKRK